MIIADVSPEYIRAE